MNRTFVIVVNKWVKSPLFLAGLGPVIVFSPILLSGKALFWGLPSLQFVPWQFYTVELLKSGYLPLWNPLNGLGTPFLANYQLGFFYPPNWLSLLAGWFGGVSALAWTHGLLIMLHLMLAGVGMVLLTRAIGLGHLGQAVSGISFGLCGYLVARTGFFTMIWVAGWLPWMFYFVTQIKPSRSKANLKNIFGLTVVMSLVLLAGHAQLAFYSILLLCFWLISYKWISDGFQKFVKTACVFAIGLVFAVFIASVQLLPTFEFLAQSQRSAAVDFDLGLTYSYWPWRFFTFFAPNLFGNPGLGIYSGYANFWEDSSYIGLLTILLALSTVTLLQRKKSRAGLINANAPIKKQKGMIIFLWSVAIIGLLFALGKNTPVFIFLYEHIPTFAMFNGPSRWLIWTEFSLCLLGGIGAEAWGVAKGRMLRIARLTFVGCAAILIGAIQSMFILDQNLRDLSWGVVFFAIGCLIFTGFVLLRNGDIKREKIWRRGIIVFLMGDLLIASWGLVPTESASYISQQGMTSNANLAGGLKKSDTIFLPAPDEYFLKFSRFFRFDSYRPLENWVGVISTLLPNTNLFTGTRFANNFDPLIPERTSRWFSVINRESGEKRQAILKQTGITILEELNPYIPLGVEFSRINSEPRLRWFSCSTAVETSDEALSLTLDLISQGKKSQVVIIEGFEHSNLCEKQSTSVIVLRKETPTGVEIDVNAVQDGWLVLADAWYPGWKVSIDGIAATIYPADYLFRGVRVPGGIHSVVFEYSPSSFHSGAIISAISIVLLGIFALIVFLRKRPLTKL